MDKIEQFRVFVQIAERESFIMAARDLQLPRTSVSAAIQQLEASLGTRLFHRTTRKVCLTADGTQLLVRARQLLSEVAEIDQLFSMQQTEVTGRLDVDVPSRIARRLIIPALPEFMKKYPKLQLGLGATDRAIDLVGEHVDCVVRFGTPPSSSLVVKPIGRVTLINCASPEYLARFGVPVLPNDLCEGHLAIGYAPNADGQVQAWEYNQNGEQKMQVLPSSVIVNNAESYIASCRAGMGLIQVPLFDVQHLIDSGELVQVMPTHRPASIEVAVLYPDRRQRSRRLTTFIDWFVSLISPHLEVCRSGVSSTSGDDA